MKKEKLTLGLESKERKRSPQMLGWKFAERRLTTGGTVVVLGSGDEDAITWPDILFIFAYEEGVRLNEHLLVWNMVCIKETSGYL